MDAVTISAIQAKNDLFHFAAWRSSLRRCAACDQGHTPNLYLELFCTLMAFSLQNLALWRISSVSVSNILCSQPVLTALVSWVLLLEKLSFIGIVGAAVILACIFSENRFCPALVPV